MSKTIRLPWPPSNNHYWTNRVVLPRSWATFMRPALGGLWGKSARLFVGKGSWPIVLPFIAADGRLYRTEVEKRVAQAFHWIKAPTTDRLRVTILAVMPDRRLRDLGNLEKASMDALTHAGVWKDDGQIDDLRIIRGRVESPGWLEVTIERIESAQGVLL